MSSKTAQNVYINKIEPPLTVWSLWRDGPSGFKSTGRSGVRSLGSTPSLLLDIFWLYA